MHMETESVPKMLSPNRFRFPSLRSHGGVWKRTSDILHAHRYNHWQPRLHIRQSSCFQQFVRITFHNGTIHERSRVTLIAITYYITGLLSLTCHLFPFLTTGESSASTSTKSGTVNFIDSSSLDISNMAFDRASKPPAAMYSSNDSASTRPQFSRTILVCFCH